jgi:hypothetical protein
VGVVADDPVMMVGDMMRTRMQRQAVDMSREEEILGKKSDAWECLAVPWRLLGH